jgi:hypothetical protein
VQRAPRRLTSGCGRGPAIRQANLDGTGANQSFITGASNPAGAIITHQHIYWGLRVTPNSRGRLLVHHHTYRVTLRLWVSYTPTGGTHRSIGFYNLHLPMACSELDHGGECDAGS